MIGVQSIEQLLDQVNEVRRKKILTNFYLDPAKHTVWIAKGDCFAERVGETLFIIRRDTDFWNVFYSSTTVDQLEADLRFFLSEHPGQTMMFDVVGRDLQCQPVVNMMKDLGCKESTVLMRMMRIGEPLEYMPDSSVRKAKEEEMAYVSELLHGFFDAQTEQIPYDEELMDYARHGQVLLCEEDDSLEGFLIYELNGSTLYLRYWFTHPDYRDKKVGSRLLRRFFDEGRETRRQLFWVICTNENAIKRYKHYGFKEENMYDYVMRYN